LKKGKQSMSDPVAVHVGKRIRQRRLLLKTTQHQVSDQVGVRFQQMQKYETGKNRVSASRLWDIANVLDVPLSFFFEGLDAQNKGGLAKSDLTLSILHEKEALDLLRAYYAMPKNQQLYTLQLIRALSKVA
jgi:transcriptional regulator with XRE-family HTH domain